MLKDNLTTLNNLLKLISSDNTYKLKQYIWWDTYNFIESIPLDYEIESDDEGGCYKSYFITGLKLNNTEKFIDFLIKEQGVDLINDIFDTKYVSWDDGIANKNNLYELAKSVLGNENKYDLLEILEEKMNFNIFYEQNDFKITENPGEQINTFIDKFIKDIKISINNYGN